MKALKLKDALYLLNLNNVQERFYVVDGLGNGECIGISEIGKMWMTYFSEHGKKWDIREYKEEEPACLDFLRRVEILVRGYGLTITLVPDILNDP